MGSSSKVQDAITIVNAHFWWPYTMTNLIPGYQYTLKVGTPVMLVQKAREYEQVMPLSHTQTNSWHREEEVQTTDRQMTARTQATKMIAKLEST